MRPSGSAEELERRRLRAITLLQHGPGGRGAACGRGSPPLRPIAFDASGISDVDYSATKTLSQMGTEFTRRGVRVTVVGASAELRDEFARFRLDIHAVSFKAVVDTLSRSYDAT